MMIPKGLEVHVPKWRLTQNIDEKPAIEVRTLRKEYQWRREAFEMWACRRIECVKWQDKMSKEEILRRVKETLRILGVITNRKRTGWGHYVRRKCLLIEAMERKDDKWRRHDELAIERPVR